MKVLHVINSLASGGAENLLKDFLPILNSNGIDIELLVLTRKGNLYENEFRKNNIKITFLDEENLYSIKQIWFIIKFLSNNKFDLIHVHLFPAQLWVAIASLLTKSKSILVTTEHSTQNRRRKYRVFRLVDRVLYSRYKKVICISSGVKNELDRWLKTNNLKTKVIHNGIILERFKKAVPYRMEEMGIDVRENSKIILMVSRLDEAKDHQTVFNALKLLPKEFILIIVGTGPLENEHKDFVKTIELQDRVFFLGYRNDVELIMKSAQIFVLSSKWEGFGLAAIEAMASGLPTIVSDVPGLSEIVEDCALKFPVGNYNILADQINEVVSSEITYLRLSELSKNRAMYFSMDKMADQYIKIYENLLNRNSEN